MPPVPRMKHLTPAPSLTILDLLRKAAAMREEHRGPVACLLVATGGCKPQSPGALMIVDDRGISHGSIG